MAVDDLPLRGADADAPTLAGVEHADGGFDGVAIGRYAVQGVLGTGGMGIVLEGRDAELDRRVAIKLLRPGLGTTGRGAGDGDGRLAREAQAMARLSHPNVVTVYEVGRHDEQRFIAMELIEGESLRAWLTARTRPWREIVAVFVAAGRGLAAAHAAGLVHRDFKPENVLIGADDRPRVTDFGLVLADDGDPIASDGAAGAGPASTLRGGATGTPAYMAPEQWAGEPIDARADQFAFAVALWEALWGERPYPGHESSEICAAVLAARPPVLASRRGVPTRIEAALRRALARDPAARWPELHLLIDAVERAARDRRPTLAAGAIALVAIGAGAVWIARPAPASRGIDCARAAERVAAVWTPARAEQIRAELVRVRPWFAAGVAPRVEARLAAHAGALAAARVETCRATHARGEQSAALLDRRMACLDERVREVELVVRLLGEDVTTKLADRAIDLVGRLPPAASCAGDDLPEIAAPTVAQQAEVERVRGRIIELGAARERGQHAQALALGVEVVAAARAIGYPPLLARALDEHGFTQLVVEDLKAAEPTLKEAAELATGAHDDRLAARAWRHLVNIASNEPERTDRFETYLAVARAAAARTGDASMINSLEHDRANALLNAGKFAEAATICADEVARLEAAQVTAGQASALACVADALGNQGDQLGATKALERALALAEANQGPDHPFTAGVLMHLSAIDGQSSRQALGLARAERALAIQSRVNGVDSESAAGSEQMICYLMVELDRAADALPHCQHAVAIADASRGPDSRFAGAGRLALAKAQAALGRTDEANATYTQALAALEKAMGPDHSELAIGLGDQASALASAGRCADAMPVYLRALGIFERALGKANSMVAMPLLGIADCELALGRPARAVAAIERALTIEQPMMRVPIARFSLAKARWAAGDRAGARASATAARAAVAVDPALAGRLPEIDAWLAGHR